MSEPKTWMNEVLKPVVVAVIVGVLSAYATGQATLARFDERLTSVERAQEAAKVREEMAARDLRAQSERLVSIETKLDLVLNRAP